MGAHMYADRCAGAIGLWFICVYSPAGWEAGIGGSEEWICGRRGAGLGFTWVCFLFEKRGGLFFS